MTEKLYDQDAYAVEFDAKGSATVRLYNNSKRTSVSVEAVGVTDSGRYMQYNSVR